MNSNAAKPKLLFFQYKYDQRLPSFILGHMREHVDCLAQFFQVILINEDCDYREICDRYEPDLTLVEGSFTVSQARRPQVTNITAHPRIPRVGFFHSDAFSQGRAGFLSDMDRWGIDTYFTISVAAAEHIPAIADRLFVWPNFVDPAIFRNYEQWKTIPVLFTGNTSNLYPWRQNLMNRVSKSYPTLICPHPGRYDPLSGSLQVLAGEPYARMLNASWFVPACGTVAKDVVRKHFEAPACGACLVTERSAALQAAGFVDMKNCVFADEKDVLDKLSYLFQHRDELESITKAGHDLVQANHTMRNRDQLLQWFNLRRNLGPGQEIVQPGPFEKLRVIDKSASRPAAHFMCGGSHLALLRLGDEHLAARRYKEARETYYKCLSTIPWMPEPQFRLALSHLYLGEPKKAECWLMEPLQFTLVEYNAADPDPIEWACFIICRLCQGRVKDALRRSQEFKWLRHPELDRVRAVAEFLGAGTWTPFSLDDRSNMRHSIHQMPERSFEQWVEEICTMLRACGQRLLAERLIRGISELGPCDCTSSHIDPGTAANDREVVADRCLPAPQPRSVQSIGRRLWFAKAKLEARTRLASTARELDAKLGGFLPYHLSARRQDVFFNAIEVLARTRNIRTVLVIGAARAKACTKAILAGAKDNSNRPSVFCIAGSWAVSFAPGRACAREAIARWYKLPSHLPMSGEARLAHVLGRIKNDSGYESFDMILIDGSEIDLKHESECGLARLLRSARFVLLDDISTGSNYENHWQMLKDQRFVLQDCNPALRSGYSIFERVLPTRAT